MSKGIVSSSNGSSQPGTGAGETTGVSTTSTSTNSQEEQAKLGQPLKPDSVEKERSPVAIVTGTAGDQSTLQEETAGEAAGLKVSGEEGGSDGDRTMSGVEEEWKSGVTIADSSGRAADIIGDGTDSGPGP